MMLHPIDNLPQCGPSGCWPRPRIPVGRPVPGGAVPGTGGHRAEGREASRDVDQVARRPSRGRRALEPVRRQAFQAFQRPGREMTPCRLRWRGIYLSDGQRWLISCGRRQVVRPQLPMLVSAGSNPVARSSKKHKHGTITVPCFFNKAPGLEPE